MTLSDPKRFILSGKALFTVSNTETGNRFTYKVRGCKDNPDLLFVSVLNGPDNWSNYMYLGIISNGSFRLTKKSKAPNGQSTKAFAWLWNRLTQSAPLPEQLDIHHEGRCGRCGRRLTVPQSIELGFGPECINYVSRGLHLLAEMI